MRFLISVGIAVAAALGALILVQIVHWIVLRIGRSSPVFIDLAHRAHRPLQAGLALIAIYYAVRNTYDAARWRRVSCTPSRCSSSPPIAWFVGALLIVAEDWALEPLADRRRGQPPSPPPAHPGGHAPPGHARRGRRHRARHHADDVPGGARVRYERARLGRVRRHHRRLRRTEPAAQRHRRFAARVQRRRTAGRRRGRRGRMGPRRGDHTELRRRAHLGRPADDPADLVLHPGAVRELDAHRLVTAGQRRVRRRLG